MTLLSRPVPGPYPKCKVSVSCSVHGAWESHSDALVTYRVSVFLLSYFILAMFCFLGVWSEKLLRMCNRHGLVFLGLE